MQVEFLEMKGYDVPRIIDGSRLVSNRIDWIYDGIIMGGLKIVEGGFLPLTLLSVSIPAFVREAVGISQPSFLGIDPNRINYGEQNMIIHAPLSKVVGEVPYVHDLPNQGLSESYFSTLRKDGLKALEDHLGEWQTGYTFPKKNMDNWDLEEFVLHQGNYTILTLFTILDFKRRSDLDYESAMLTERSLGIGGLKFPAVIYGVEVNDESRPLDIRKPFFHE